VLDIIQNAPWAEIAGIAALLILAFDRIAKITPTKTDDKIVKFIQRAATVLGVKVRDNPGKAAD
jgi:hypothetical protein